MRKTRPRPPAADREPASARPAWRSLASSSFDAFSSEGRLLEPNSADAPSPNSTSETRSFFALVPSAAASISAPVRTASAPADSDRSTRKTTWPPPRRVLTVGDASTSAHKTRTAILTAQAWRGPRPSRHHK